MRHVAVIFVVGALAMVPGLCSGQSSLGPVAPPGSSLKASTVSAVPPTPDCYSIAEAGKHIGKKHCVSGMVLRVTEGSHGVTFLDFCPDYRTCPFTVVVFSSDRRKLGDLRQFQGRMVTIRGRIEEYDDRAEIILRHPEQLGDHAALLSATPRDYDVERRGHFSAGTFRHGKTKKPRHSPQGPPDSSMDVDVEQQ